MDNTENHIKDITVGISYSWEDDEHQEWVLKLASKLKAEGGVDVILDRNSLTYGKDKNKFMEDFITKSDKVLIILTPIYKEKAEERKGGAGYEYSIINVELADDIEIQNNKPKYLPILRKGEIKNSCPIYLQKFFIMDMIDDLKYEEDFLILLRAIYGLPLINLPEKGSIPKIILKELGQNIEENDSGNNVASNSLSKLEKVIDDPNKYFYIHSLFTEEIKSVVTTIESPLITEIKDYPNKPQFDILLSMFENTLDTLLKMMLLISRFASTSNCYEIIQEAIQKIKLVKRNNKDGYGYLWRHFSYYPLTLIFYTLGTFYIKRNDFKKLFNLFNEEINYESTYNFEKMNLYMYEIVDAYHIFGEANMKFYEFLDENTDETGSEIKKRLRGNLHIKNYVKEVSQERYYLNSQDFEDTFDQFEFFSGLVMIDERLQRQTIEFGSYGIRFWKYNNSGRYYNDSNHIAKFIKDVSESKNDILKLGFFGGEKERFLVAYEKYISLLRNIRT